MDEKGAVEEPKANVPRSSGVVLFRYFDGMGWLLFIIGGLGAVCSGVLIVFFGPLLSKVFNAMSEISPTATLQEALDEVGSKINDACLLITYVGCGMFASNFIMAAFSGMAGARVSMRAKTACMKAALNQDCEFYDVKSTPGDVVHVIQSQITQTEIFIVGKIPGLLNSLGQLCGGLSIAFYYGWEMTLVTMSVAPAIAVVIFIANIMNEKANQQSEAALQKSSGFAGQVLANVRTVFSFNAGELTVKSYTQQIREPLKVGLASAWIKALATGAMMFCGFAAMPLAMWFGGLKVNDGSYTSGDVFAVLSPLLMAVMSMAAFAPAMRDYVPSVQAAQKVMELADSTSTLVDPEDGVELQPEEVKGRVMLQDVDFSYPASPGVQVLKGVSLAVPAGNSAALVGESGSGKSTIVSILLRFYDPSAGRVLLDGQDIRAIRLHSLRGVLGLVSQEPVLFAMSIGENIAYGKPGADQVAIESAARSAQIHEFIISLPDGYNTLVGEKGAQLSGGQKQRIAIARTMIRKPRVFILDEATSALDTKSERAIQAALSDLTAGSTTISIAHRLSTVRNCDVIAVMNSGKILETGTHDALMAKGGAYAALVAKQGGLERIEKEEEEEGTITELEDKQTIFKIAKTMSLRGTLSTRKSSLTVTSSRGLLEKGTSTRLILIPVLSPDLEKEPQEEHGVGPTFVPSMLGMQAIHSMRDEMMQVISNRASAHLGDIDEEVAAPPAAPKATTSRAFGIAKPYSWFLFIGFVGTVMAGAAQPILGWIFSLLINVYNSTGLGVSIMPEVSKYACILVGVAGAVGIGNFMQEYGFETVAQRMAFHLRCLLMEALMRQEIGWFDQEENGSGALLSHLNSDVLAAKGQVTDLLAVLGQVVGALFAGFPISLVHQWQVALVVISVAPILIITIAITGICTQGMLQDEREASILAETVSAESLNNYKVVGAFSLADQRELAYENLLKKKNSVLYKLSYFMGAAQGFVMFSVFSIYALAFWYGGKLVTEQKAVFSDVTTAIFPVFLALVYIGQAQTRLPEVARGQAALTYIFETVDREPVIDNSSDEGLEPDECMGNLSFNGLKFAYPARPDTLIFKDFSLKIPAGTSMALVGHSGCGKSSLVGLALRFYDPLEGRVTLDGRDIRRLSLRWLRSQYGLVSQEPVLFNGTILDNIRYGNQMATREECEIAAKVANATDFIESLPDKYDTPIGEQSIQLSGGQKQRIAIARAMVRNPRILLLDEATSALDNVSERAVQVALDAAMVGRTAIVIAHRLATVSGVDTITVMEKGEIVESGNHEELMALNGKYSMMVNLQTM